MILYILYLVLNLYIKITLMTLQCLSVNTIIIYTVDLKYFKLVRIDLLITYFVHAI